MDESGKKTPMGVKPTKMVINDRNMDLSNAIWNCSLKETKTLADYRIMAIWATEISMNCNMMLALDKTTKMLGEI